MKNTRLLEANDFVRFLTPECEFILTVLKMQFGESIPKRDCLFIRMVFNIPHSVIKPPLMQ